MSEIRTWQTLPNPFQSVGDKADVVTGHVSGRSKDISKIINSTQSAILLAGAPNIGKSALIRYLQRPPQAEWSWRNEGETSAGELDLNDVHFVPVDLTSLAYSANINELLNLFIAQCKDALQSILQDGQAYSSDLKGLLSLLDNVGKEKPKARYFVMLDTIEKLDRFNEEHDLYIRDSQKNGLTLLDDCGIIRTLVELIDEYSIFGVILSIRSLPRSKPTDRISHVSRDLARFTTTTLQAFSWDDTGNLLEQRPENFGSIWAHLFRAQGGICIFSKEEQMWLREQAGTHPYLLRQFCIEAFNFKQEYAKQNHTWTELQERHKSQLVDKINEIVTNFFIHFWDRIQEAIDKSSKETRNKFYDFINLLAKKRANDVIGSELWSQFGPELRFILYSEGILRDDLIQPIHFPGSLMRQYLLQQAKEYSKLSVSQATPTTTGRGRELSIAMPGNQSGRLLLSDLEYHLLKILIQNPERCGEEELMLGAWSKKVEKSTFSQRIHHLRKKLREQCGREIIANRYGGIYSLNHPEWFYLE